MRRIWILLPKAKAIYYKSRDIEQTLKTYKNVARR
jgi:hypothetical protein